MCLRALLATGALATMNISLAAEENMSNNIESARLDSSHYEKGAYVNANPEIKQDLSKLGSILKRYLFEKRVDPVPTQVPLKPINSASLTLDSENAVYRLGHSSILLKLQGKVWLIDPVFSKRASFVQWMGPKRFHSVPLDLNNLPDIEGVIISHDHYDHLDKQSIKQLNEKVAHFIVPLGVDNHLTSWGIPAEKIHSLDWWQTLQVGDVNFTATPAQHFSGRGLFDGNETLWASWVIKTDKHSLFFSGDSGYFDGFKLIGERFGPFDITMMETGAYDINWPDIHMLPEESVQAHIDLKGKVLMPIHNGTFDLALHPWYEPFERITAAAAEKNVTIATPIMGEALLLNQPRKNQRWWQRMLPQEPLTTALLGEH